VGSGQQFWPGRQCDLKIELEPDDQTGNVCRFYLIFLLTQYKTEAYYKIKNNVLKKESNSTRLHKPMSLMIVLQCCICTSRGSNVLPICQNIRILDISPLKSAYSLPPTLIPLSGVGTTCFSSCCDKDLVFIFTTGRLPDVNPP
jgi:hypothetical protein